MFCWGGTPAETFLTDYSPAFSARYDLEDPQKQELGREKKTLPTMHPASPLWWKWQRRQRYLVRSRSRPPCQHHENPPPREWRR